MGFFKKAKKSIKNAAKGVKSGSQGAVKALKDGDIKGLVVEANRIGTGSTDVLTFGGTSGLNNALRNKIDPLLGRGVGPNGGSFSLKDAKDAKNLSRVAFNQDQARVEAKKAEDEQRKRRNRRGNINTAPLGALVSRALTTRNLTGS